MTLYRKSLALLAATAFLGGVMGTAIAQDTAAPAAAATTAEKDEPGKVLATVNGVAITQGEVDQAATDLDPQFGRLPVEQRRLAALAALIDIKALAAEGEKNKLDQTEEFKRRMGFLKDRALHNEVFKAEIVEKITDEDARARYDKEISALPAQNEVRARHILVKEKKDAEDIIKKLDGGANFEDLAKENSTDGSAAQGGDLGYFGEGMMVPEFETAAFALEPGSYTKEPVESQFGFHVIKVEDKRAKQPPAFEQVKDEIRSMIMRERYVTMIKDLRDGMKITYDDPAVEKAMTEAEAEQAAEEAETKK
jgi:peptidyl-prolyl cis-trans isomerase C